ncbi:hypothetical protein CA13_48970 [Planctomycetes bacterium CA13]|uniref:DUF11 domain-containing protein n=1 Tax=Novipirellula herctigrandis TaxID=2527986 RepID=A0A5C5Z7W2_9BACT|nr:hypothetical protein CA13_48970 [Planctomycetes bacterium CA13]
MSRIKTLSHLTSIAIMVMATGCQLPGQRTNPVSTPSAPTPNAAAALPVAPSQCSPTIQQVGCILPGTDPACSGDGCSSDNCEAETFSISDCNPTSQSCANGCLACQSDCNVVPHGYADYGPMAWNAFGIDPNEFLCNGDDYPPDAFVRQNDQMGGLRLEDTVVDYTTEAGDIHVQPSNRTCIYSPRFASVRKITGAISGGRAVGAAGFALPVGPNRVQYDQPQLTMTDTTELAHADITRRIDAMRDRNRGVRIESVLQPEIAEDVLEVLAKLSAVEITQLQENQLALLQEAANAAVAWAIDESVEVAIEDVLPPTLTRDQRVEELTIYEFPDAGRLQICKLADKKHAQPGEIVTFMIRVENVGDSAVSHVHLTDNLTTRLEYVADSQTCSGGAEFKTEANEGESLTLMWNLTDTLKVGESVTIRFKCKVR